MVEQEIIVKQIRNDDDTLNMMIMGKLVRCKDCKFVGTYATCCLVCEREGMGLRPFHVYHEDFCSRGERKDGDDGQI